MKQKYFRNLASGVKYVVAFLFSFLVVSVVFAKNKNQRPNILFIMSDDHTSQAWGLYGGILKDYVKNVNIQRLANEGCVLENAFCTNSICTPSRAAILTGQYSHMNRVYTLREPLSPDHVNIAGLLKQDGYQTAVIGKWHLVNKPQGFDYYNVLPGQGVYFDPVLKNAETWEDGYGGGIKHRGFSTNVITDLTIKWLKERDPQKPFLMLTHFKATHEPFHYPEKYSQLYKNMSLPEPESLYDFNSRTTGRSFKGQKLEVLGERMLKASVDPDNFWTTYPGLPFTTEGLDSIQTRKKIYQKFIKDFLRCGAVIDENIGKLLDYLDKTGLAENTVVIYTADQGYFLGEHGFFDKRLIYEESLRMPFVIRYPREIPAGTRNSDIVLNIDFSALMADYAGIQIQNTIQGTSFRNNLIGYTPTDWRKSMYYRYWLHRIERPGHFGLRNKRFKLVFFYGQPLGMKGAMKTVTNPAWEFYDLKKDPQENHNAYQDGEYADIIKTMKAELLIQRKMIGDMDKEYPIMQDIIDKYWD